LEENFWDQRGRDPKKSDEGVRYAAGKGVWWGKSERGGGYVDREVRAEGGQKNRKEMFPIGKKERRMAKWAKRAKDVRRGLGILNRGGKKCWEKKTETYEGFVKKTPKTVRHSNGAKGKGGGERNLRVMEQKHR